MGPFFTQTLHKIGGDLISKWPDQKIGGATLGCILVKYKMLVMPAIAPPVQPSLQGASALPIFWEKRSNLITEG